MAYKNKGNNKSIKVLNQFQKNKNQDIIFKQLYYDSLSTYYKLKFILSYIYITPLYFEDLLYY